MPLILLPKAGLVDDRASSFGGGRSPGAIGPDGRASHSLGIANRRAAGGAPDHPFAGATPMPKTRRSTFAAYPLNKSCGKNFALGNSAQPHALALEFDAAEVPGCRL
jgi:hypothetical protein